MIMRWWRERQRRIDIFQDVVGWQPGESRNALVADIRDKVEGALRAKAARAAKATDGVQS
jgi:hypothetical protein